MEERLQKLLSIAGVCSRRTAETYIQAGRVTINGVKALLGDKADLEQDQIAVDGRLVERTVQHIYLLLNKPRGFVTTLSDEQGRRTVMDLVSDCGARVWPVGRLDLDSEGLLLLTNDGGITNKLTHPGHEVEKEYLVTVSGDIESALPILRGSVELDGTMIRPAKIERVGASILSITIHEGKNRQVRRMCAKGGLDVRRLRRVREGEIRLGRLKSGAWRQLTAEELAYLKGLQ